MFCVDSGADKLFKTIKMNNLGLIVENLLHLIITPPNRYTPYYANFLSQNSILFIEKFS